MSLRKAIFSPINIFTLFCITLQKKTIDVKRVSDNFTNRDPSAKRRRTRASWRPPGGSTSSPPPSWNASIRAPPPPSQEAPQHQALLRLFFSPAPGVSGAATLSRAPGPAPSPAIRSAKFISLISWMGGTSVLLCLTSSHWPSGKSSRGAGAAASKRLGPLRHPGH